MNERNSCVGNTVVGLLFGLACGYAIGILTAEKSGKELRRDIGSYSSDLVQKINQRFSSFKEVVLEKVAEFKNFSDEQLKNTAKNIEDLVDSLDKQLDELTKKQASVKN